MDPRRSSNARGGVGVFPTAVAAGADGGAQPNSDGAGVIPRQSAAVVGMTVGGNSIEGLIMPFSASEFLDVFRQYNSAIWPMQLALAAAGVGCGVLVIRGGARASRIIAMVLASLWAWMAGAYHFAFFASINPAAIVFGSVFIAEAVLLFWYGVRREQLRFAFSRDSYGLVGAIMSAFALICYPILGFALGRRYPEAPTFGLPCPTTIFTLGFLLLARGPGVKVAVAIPFLWSLLGAFAATRLGVTEDYSLLVAGVVTLALVIWRDRSTLLPRRLSAELERRGTPLALQAASTREQTYDRTSRAGSLDR